MSDKKEPDFETAMKKLNGIVENLEKGDLTLEASLKLYEEGVSMSQLCAKRLEEAQKKIEVLTRGSDGSFSTTPVDEETLKPKSKKSRK